VLVHEPAFVSRRIRYSYGYSWRPDKEMDELVRDDFEL